MPKGVFDEMQKKDFKDPFKENAERIAQVQKKSADQMVDEAMAKTVTPPVEAEKPPEIPNISKEDLDLAERMIFNNYAEIDVSSPNLEKYTFTITTMSAEEINLIDELVYEYVKENDDKISNQMVNTFRSLCSVALSYRGMNKKELCEEDGTAQLNTLKTAVMRSNELLSFGKIDEAGKLRDEIKKKLKYRIMKVRRLSPAVIDFILDEKFKFDQKIHNILNIKGVVPKS
jgi:hypothetical protein